MSTQERWTLRWEHGEATVQALGGMLAPVRFDLGDGQSVSPLHVAPWGDDDRYPGLMRALRGEWPCVPFGTIDPLSPLPSGFEAKAPDDEWRHGYSANHMWQQVEQTADALTLRIDYPPESVVERLDRVIEVDRDAPALTVSLAIRMRRDAVLPFALHPTFAVPPEGVEVLACPFDAVHTYPVAIEPGVSRILPDRTFEGANALNALQTPDGPCDVTRLPLPNVTEELLQLQNCQPPFVLRYPANAADVLLDWSTDDMQDAVMWISNGGRANAPWSSNNYALGVEPVNGFFDIGRVVVPPAHHPLAARVGLTLRADTPRTIRYRLSARKARTGQP